MSRNMNMNINMDITTITIDQTTPKSSVNESLNGSDEDSWSFVENVDSSDDSWYLPGSQDDRDDRDDSSKLFDTTVSLNATDSGGRLGMFHGIVLPNGGFCSGTMVYHRGSKPFRMFQGNWYVPFS